MSRVNKVNPGKYTQRGRLSQDDAARETAKQRAPVSDLRAKPGQKNAQRTPPRNAKTSEEENQKQTE